MPSIPNYRNKENEMYKKDPNRYRVELARLDFTGMNLCGKCLANVYMYETILDHADLSGANLRGIILRQAKLRFTNFSYSRMMNADFSGADLTGADFSYSDLTGAIFSGAIVEGANFTGARVDLTIGLTMSDLIVNTAEFDFNVDHEEEFE